MTAGHGLPHHPDEPGIKASAASTGGSLALIQSTLTSGPPHHFTIDTGAATVLLIATPGGIEDYFREMSAAPDETTRRSVRDAYGIHRA